MMDGRQPGFFTDDAGTPSAMRLMCFVALGAAVLFGVAASWRDSEIALAAMSVCLAAAFGGKVSQKKLEPIVGRGTE